MILSNVRSEVVSVVVHVVVALPSKSYSVTGAVVVYVATRNWPALSVVV
jgi:hypothetical protein